jgi:hypothetical protein
MAAKRYLADDEEGLRKLIHNVLDSNSESCDFFEDETESGKGNSDNSNESSDENNEIDSEPGPSKHVLIMPNKKQSGWKWGKTDNNPIIYEFSENSGVYDELLNKFESEPPSELQIILAFLEPLFQRIADETNNYATLQLNNECKQKEVER